jgi:Flp pilus assembly protein TadB
MIATTDPLPLWAPPELIVGTVMLLAAMAAGAAAVRSLPEARRLHIETRATADAPTKARRVRRWLSRLLGHLRMARSAPIPAAQVAAWCDAISRRLRAGETLRTAFEAERPDDRGLLARTEPLRRSLRHGATVADAVAATMPDSGSARVSHDPHLELLCSVVAATADFGGSAAAPIDRVGATLRLRNADGQEREAQSAQARLSAHVLTVVPLAVLALLASTDADVRQFSTGGLGLTVIASGLALNLTGWWWMKRIVTAEAS